jgi:hypothetical protein
LVSRGLLLARNWRLYGLRCRFGGFCPDIPGDATVLQHFFVVCLPVDMVTVCSWLMTSRWFAYAVNKRDRERSGVVRRQHARVKARQQKAFARSGGAFLRRNRVMFC